MIPPTECDDLLRLTPRQETAVELLLAGKSDAATAESLGIHRTTIARWRAAHPAFQAELARRRAELYGAAAERLRALVPKALDVLEAGLNGDDRLPTAHAILKMTGLDKLAAPPSEPDDAEAIVVGLIRQRMDEKQDEREQQMSLDERLLAMHTPDSRESQLALGHEALAEVKAELRERLSGELDHQSGIE